ncbi:MAG: aminomethyl-transferring glycine dehydrogenase [Bacteroidetes bacterium]|nr:aminomethyl-transferring glycine dehydrogenase [Bacteroidota bacterium]MBU1721049.1 aminomethyl-transferring glycine dehydrogenase [Bacteroidota bacterium]
MYSDSFVNRHIGPQEGQIAQMLETIGVGSVEELIEKTIPSSIRLTEDPGVATEISEYEYSRHVRAIAQKNKMYQSYIGMGYYASITPPVILRNLLESPGWYTAYTPYQAEISQGRLEALLVFQTMISDLTGLPIANASLLDEGTAAAEAITMFFNSRSREAVKNGANRFFVSKGMFPQTKAVLVSRSSPLGIELVFGKPSDAVFDNTFFGAMIQYPCEKGGIHDPAAFVAKAQTAGIPVAIAADLMSLVLLDSPAKLGVDCIFGNSQRFGIPVGYGGPHAAFFAASEKFKRNMPGRIIGITIDAQNNYALRMALQTREQHIKRERATSNICTAQALLANMAAMYAVYHGPEGITNIAKGIHDSAVNIAGCLKSMGYKINNEHFFDTLNVELPLGVSAVQVRRIALQHKVNFRYFDNGTIGLSVDETVDQKSLNNICDIFAKAAGKRCTYNHIKGTTTIPAALVRTDKILTHPVFNKYHSESEMMRYLKKLENKDLTLNRTMIPLGSCTMKLNAVSELAPVSWSEFGTIHPFVPADQAKGYSLMIRELSDDLCKLTGFSAISLQPNSGAAGEYAGLMVIREYLISIGQHHRDICLIPASAHGTNPASAVMAGMNVIVTKCDENGNIDLNDLTEKAIQHKDNLAAVMVTYPSTHGVFEENILDVIRVIHENGGQVYMDGANMNAQVGYTNPGHLGADVCHLNLHKTFAIPHGGGGPGVGPIGVKDHLVPFLPSHPVVKTGGKRGISAVSAAPFGSAMILPISYGYIKMMGGEGLKRATAMAILNANYLRAKLKKYYKILYTGKQGMVAHEMILDCNEFKRTADIDVIDIAKRLMDYGFHAPTVAFPVHGTLMVEPTESEPLCELDRFVDAMIAIREEIREIEEGKADKANNVLKNSPHTIVQAAASEWAFPYSREKAVFPVAGLKDNKYWPAVARVNDGHGDRNLMCICGTPEEYQ